MTKLPRQSFTHEFPEQAVKMIEAEWRSTTYSVEKLPELLLLLVI